MPLEKPKRNPDFNAKLLPDGFVLLYSSSSDWVHTLTPLGGLVWEFCDGENSIEQIAQLVKSSVQTDAGENAIAELIKDLDKKGLFAS